MTAPKWGSTALLKQHALELGFTTVGICEAVPSPHINAYKQWLQKGYHGTMGYLSTQLPIKLSPQSLLPSARSIIAVSLNYNQPNPSVPGQPHIARYALGRDYHKVIRSKLKRLSAWITSEYPGSETKAVVDSAPILERDYAHLAGLGWFGKNTCLIDSRRGSWFFIGLILTSVEFEPDKPAIGSCGSCKKCIDACPTGAIVFEDQRWQVDARRCISYLTIEHRGEIDPELAKKVGGWTFGCDICQEVCPFNEQRPTQPLRGLPTTEGDLLGHRDWPSLQELVQVSQEKWDQQTRGTAVRRAGFEGLKRNAKINLKLIPK